MDLLYFASISYYQEKETFQSHLTKRLNDEKIAHEPGIRKGQQNVSWYRILFHPQWIYEYLSFVFVIKKVMIRPKTRLRRHELLSSHI